jgi:RNA polymerase sigma-70 factor (ECF subfamily)
MTANMDGSLPGAERNPLAPLLRAVAGGDRGALAILYERTSAKLYGICLRVLGSEAEAEEALQEAYIAVWRRAETYDPAKAGVIAWLAVLARNKAIDRLRRRSHASAPLDAAGEVADDAPSALDLIESAEDAARLTACLAELEEKQQALIRAAFWSGASYPELAEREAVPLGTMKSWIRRSLIRLRGCLER